MKIQFKQTALRIHASLIAIGIWYVLQDNLMSLLVAVLTLFLHEAAHFIAGKKLGFQINEIELTPFGAIMQVQNLSAQSTAHRFCFAMAGPLGSLLGCLLAFGAAANGWGFLSLARSFFHSNLLLLLVNLLPALPLDGGRMLRAIMEKPLGYRRATQTMVWIGYGIGCGLGILSVLLALRGMLNPLPAFAGVYLCYAAAQEAQQSMGHYVTSLIARRQRMEQGRSLSVQAIAVSEKTPLSSILPQLAAGKYHFVCLLSEDGMTCKRVLDEKQLCDKLFQSHNIPAEK